MDWQFLPEHVLVDHYELKDNGAPTNGELKLDARLHSIHHSCQRLLSNNFHSVFNKRHYLTYGGFFERNNLIKPPWVDVQQTADGWMDRCTLCRGKKGKLLWCNDGHLQSSQHRQM